MFKSVAVILLALGLTQAALVPVGDLLKDRRFKEIEAGVRSDAGAYVDQILANLRAQMSNAGMDSIPLPPYNFTFSETILGITWHGEAILKDGSLKGLETMHRTGVADISTEDTGDFIITVEAGVNDGTLGYTGVVKFMNLGPSITAAGTLKSVSVLITIRIKIVNIITGTLEANLDKLDIKHLGTLNVDIKGLGIILNFVAELIVNAIGNLVKGVVGELLQGPIKNLLNEIIKNTLNHPTPRFALEGATVGFQAARAVPHYLH